MGSTMMGGTPVTELLPKERLDEILGTISVVKEQIESGQRNSRFQGDAAG